MVICASIGTNFLISVNGDEEKSVRPAGGRGPAAAAPQRRGAFKKVKVVQEFKGHKFVAKFFRQPSVCSFCQGFLW